jgi:hypothetical protein
MPQIAAHKIAGYLFTMKSAAIRQQEMRQRRREEGALRQLNLWVQVEAHEKLKLISRSTQKSMSDALSDVLNQHDSVQNPKGKRSPRKDSGLSQCQLELFE